MNQSPQPTRAGGGWVKVSKNTLSAGETVGNQAYS
ncbi:hypothetical protein PPL_02996 [Heterostelium album PN500]|uniref:Uncharacterized protein n=1 Tax=Heterostelium pallidum (strain ATCC 26659 / Pp 5 / PN500) TaxID=670386 RepID=D3B3M8_HETP5|nr:hypothetical protein PPL_02996 [Heterostelium album PN500]EFA83926.1 hypothetical protein PPL_02996 [Heterostelium album PN500]|eukprot:XP_020436043.1 hypothetical protein PPL_02996 [Heterostelium album PN500]